MPRRVARDRACVARHAWRGIWCGESCRMAAKSIRRTREKPMRLLYIMDPVESILPDKDTTFAFLRSAQHREHENFHAELSNIYLARGEVRACARRVRVADASPFLALDAEIHDLAVPEFGAVLVRKDPPFDPSYLHTTLLLEHARGKTLLINDPRGLREANEKLYALNFPEFAPRTMVSASREQLLGFVAEVGRAVIN